ncbi:MAG: hypothetical protein FWG74_05765, partial [Planctomycetes bacterium]|nr:hypothetical protein [Planctomycetota bacterium]
NVDSPFPFSAPKVAEWHARIVDASILIRRRGYDLELNLNPAEASGQAGNDLVTLTADRAPFSFGRTGSEKRFTGRAGAISLMFPINPGSGFSPFPTPGQSSIRVEGLPVAMAPFLLSGIPLENTAGFFTGSIAYREHPDAAGVLTFEGELHDALLSIFGLPRNAPLRLNWPMGPKRPNLNVGLHLGPSGFGAFTMVVSLDASGRPRLLSMQGEIAALDDIPDIISRNERWTDWLSRSFTSVEWRTAKWRGFGWSGEDMRLNLIRTTAGLNLTGEAELMRGRLQLALAPNQQDMPISLAGEQIDAGLMSANLSDRLPEAFRVRLAGSHASFNWRGYRTDEGIGDWSAGLVFVKPEIDIAASGAWWTILGEAARAIAQALPEWGGGDPAGLLAIAAGVKLPLDQLSIVAEQSAEAYTVIEFRAYGDVFGQATGMLESRPDGTVEGEFRLDGPSQVIAEVERVNSDLALILALLANDSPGLRIQFLAQPDKKPEFNFPFLDEAKSILEELTREKMGEG